ncbi:pyridoxamine 5'-phosphate oxidase family protein [Paucibacter sp. AS339]|uniref:pyridoxamine 5'-phosphate oxidase family protein n=1 Tax=Paucibacter hankyongi TaxID=3133434 RepID=UPI0030A42D02
MNPPLAAIPSATAPSTRSRVRRIAENARYERETVYAILDAAYLCHIAFSDEQGSHCIPTACWREGDSLYIHGSNGSRMVKHLKQGAQACVAITHLDGLVLARSAFNHSMNYRSCVIYGQFEAVTDAAEKRASLDAFMHKIAPGREHEARPGNAKEFAATTVLRIPLDEAACKVRSGPPQDDEQDLALPVWAGVLPLRQEQTTAIAALDNVAPEPAYVRNWHMSSAD